LKNTSAFFCKPYFGLLKLTCCGLLLFILPVSYLHAQNKAASEYQVKAVFLFNFTQFIEWPAETFNSPDEPFVIGIIGENPFGTYINETVSGEKYGTHPIVIKNYKKREDIGNCQMLYITSDEQEEVKNILASISQKNILTVNDLPGFTKNGGMVQFYIENNKIRLRINVERSKAAGLNISSKLLSVAETN
jgi:hypothetical protein